MQKKNVPDQLANACFLTARTASRLSPATWQGHTHPNVCTTSIDGSEGFVKIHVQRLLSPCVDVQHLLSLCVENVEFL